MEHLKAQKLLVRLQLKHIKKYNRTEKYVKQIN